MLKQPALGLSKVLRFLQKSFLLIFGTLKSKGVGTLAKGVVPGSGRTRPGRTPPGVPQPHGAADASGALGFGAGGW